jgi:hypothetical protein
MWRGTAPTVLSGLRVFWLGMAVREVGYWWSAAVWLALGLGVPIVGLGLLCLLTG